MWSKNKHSHRIPKHTEIKSSSSSPAHIFAYTCILWSGSALKPSRFIIIWPPTNNPFNTGMWHPSCDTFPPSDAGCHYFDVLHDKIACTITLYGGKCFLSLQLTQAARFLLQSFHGALCTEQWISGLCASCGSLFTFSQGKLAAALSLGLPIRAQASADPDFCFCTTKLFTAFTKRNASNTHLMLLSSKSVKWSETCIFTDSLGNCSYPHPFSLYMPASTWLMASGHWLLRGLFPSCPAT